MAKKSTSDVRTSLVDVFENFFGQNIVTLRKGSIGKLSVHQLDELVEHIDRFLDSAKDQKYPNDAVMLDCLTNPIIFPKDTTIPKTIRQAKQVLLNHQEVIIPFQPLSIDYRYAINKTEARQYPQALLEWTKQNHLLIRKHIISVSGRPSPFDVLGEEHTKQLVAELIRALKTPEFSEIKSRIIQPNEVGTPDEDNSLDAWIYALLIDAVNANSIGGNIAFLDQDSGCLYEKIAQSLKSPSKAHNQISDVQILQALKLPAIDDIHDSDFVAIRTQSDDFEEFRGALSRVLSKTKSSSKDGNLQDAFRANLDEIHIRAEALRREIKDKAVKRFLKSAIQNSVVGAITSTSSTAAVDLSLGHLQLPTLATRWLTSVGVGTLLAAFNYRPPRRKERLLRFYSILLGQSPTRRA